MDHPRKVAEFAHQFNRGARVGSADLPRLSFRFYDLEDFFTHVPIRILRADILATIAALQRRNPNWRFF